jgi:hypothetical protein
MAGEFISSETMRKDIVNKYTGGTERIWELNQRFVSRYTWMYNGKVNVSRRNTLHVQMYCRTCFEKTLKEGGINLECTVLIYITIVPNSISLTPKHIITDKRNGFIKEITHTNVIN